MFNKLVRIGRDAELKFLPSGTAVANLPCVYDIGFGDKKRGQWIDVAIFGKQAEALSQYLLKGKQIVIYADDVELEQYAKKDGTQGAKIKCRAVNIDLTSGGQSPQQQSAPQQAPQPQGGQGFQQAPPQGQFQRAPQQAPKVNPQEPVMDFDDDIPF